MTPTPAPTPTRIKVVPTVTLAGLAAAQLSTAVKNIIVQSIAAVVGLAPSAVTIKSVADGSPSPAAKVVVEIITANATAAATTTSQLQSLVPSSSGGNPAALAATLNLRLAAVGSSLQVATAALGAITSANVPACHPACPVASAEEEGVLGFNPLDYTVLAVGVVAGLCVLCLGYMVLDRCCCRDDGEGHFQKMDEPSGGQLHQLSLSGIAINVQGSR